MTIIGEFIDSSLAQVEVDSEVVDETIDLLTKMYRQLDAASITGARAVDVREISYIAICKQVKAYGQQADWARSAKPDDGNKIPDITFAQAAELASKRDPIVDDYIGKTYRHNAKRAIQHLRTMFRERQNVDFEGGKNQSDFNRYPC